MPLAASVFLAPTSLAGGRGPISQLRTSPVVCGVNTLLKVNRRCGNIDGCVERTSQWPRYKYFLRHRGSAHVVSISSFAARHG